MGLIASLTCCGGGGAKKDSTAPAPKDERLIDVHAHIGTFKGYDLSEATLIESIATANVRMALISNIDGAALPDTTGNLSEKDANDETVKAVARHPGQLRGIAWSRPNDGSAANLDPYFDKKPPDAFVAVKFHPEMNQFPADDAKTDPYLDLCEKWQVPAVFHSDAEGSNAAPSKIYAAAKRHPKVAVVLYHMGFGGGHDAAIAVAKEAWTKKDAQLYLETAQADPAAVIKAVKELGAEKVLFGTDATYYGKGHYTKYEPLLKALKAGLNATEYEMVTRLNAIKLFKL